jgi:septum formation topological specificity factor MinE
MRERSASKEQARLISVLVRDRLGTSQETVSMLRSDVAHLLEDYFDLDKDSLKVALDAKEDGVYIVRIIAKAVRIKT